MSGNALKTSAAKLAALATRLVSPCSRPRACCASSAYSVGLSVAVMGAASNTWAPHAERVFELSRARFLRVRSNETPYYRAMSAPAPLSIAEARHDRAESARLDNFVDGAFAFAITLLVISGASLPRNVAALEHALRGIPAFAACFAQLAIFWHGHVRWRDSVHLTDRASLMLSLLLVFFALIFVFPLHLVYASFFSAITHGWLSPDFVLTSASLSALAALFACYGLSYACM